MNSDVEIQGLLKEISDSGKYEILEGVVQSVNEDDYTVDVEVLEDVVIPSVKLRAITGKDGFILIPSKKSKVVFCEIRGTDDYTLINADKLDKILIDVAIQVDITSAKILFNGGKNNGLPFSAKVSERLNKIENDLNLLKNAIKTAPTTSSDGGAYFKAGIIAMMGKALQLTKIKDIENIKIKQ